MAARSPNGMITAVLLFVIIGLISESQLPFGAEVARRGYRGFKQTPKGDEKARYRSFT